MGLEGGRYVAGGGEYVAKGGKYGARGGEYGATGGEMGHFLVSYCLSNKRKVEVNNDEYMFIWHLKL